MWWLIIPIAVFISILCIVLNEAHERQVKQSARMPIDDSWLFDNVDEPYREFEFETSDETEIFKDMTDRIKLEDMTLSEIQSVKFDLASSIDIAINEIIARYKDRYDVGDVIVDVHTEFRKPFKTEPSKAFLGVKIKFSKEDGTDIHED